MDFDCKQIAGLASGGGQPPEQAASARAARVAAVAETTTKLEFAFFGKAVPRDVLLETHRLNRERGLKRVASGAGGAQKSGEGADKDGDKPSTGKACTTKPNKRLPDVAKLLPMAVRDLALGTTHCGRVLRGRVVALPAFADGVTDVIVEDVAGELVQVCVHNLADAETHEAIDKMFAIGTRVDICEPFYAVIDVDAGRLGIRVDKPAELLFERLDGPGEEPKELGNRLFRSQDYLGAFEQYTQGLKAHGEVAVVLGNAAACCLELREHPKALGFAMASLTVEPSYPKAWFRAAMALHKMGKRVEARAAYRLAPEAAKAVLRETVDLTVSYRESYASPFQTLCQAQITDLVMGIPDGDSPGESTWDALKDQGNEYFRERKYRQALGRYMAAARLAQEPVVKLLSNRSACGLHLNQHEKAVVDATCALVLDGGDSLKALYRRASGLREMQAFGASLHTVEHALRRREAEEEEEGLLAQVRALRVEVERLNRQEGAHIKQRRAKGRKTTEDRVEALMNKGAMSGRQLLKFNGMMDKTLSEDMREVLFDDRVPAVHTEYASGGHFPPQVNVEKCQEWLLTVFEESRTIGSYLRIQEQAVKRNPKKVPLEQVHFMKRLGTHEGDALNWWVGSPAGDVWRMRPRPTYASDVLHSFSTVLPRSVHLHFGGTHVAVGYVDLGLLLTAEMHGDPDEDGPTRFVGYESSAYCTAKTEVIADMLFRGVVVDSILQVWFSSSWSEKTLALFRETVGRLGEEAGRPEEVVTILRHWARASRMTLRTAQEKWLALHESHHCIPVNLLQMSDRVEVISYLLTGRLLHCDVGSIVMFDNPPGMAHVAKDESALWVVHDDRGLMKDHIITGSVMNAVYRRLRSRITRLQRMCVSGQVKIDLNLQAVAPDTPETHVDILAAQPRSISWSSLCDYCTPDEFHDMAQACSLPGKTVHYVYSMNWIRDVKGTFAMDYPLENQLKLVDLANNAISAELEAADLDLIFVRPPVQHPYNITDAMLARSYYGAWVEYFFENTNVSKENMGYTLVRPFSIFGRSRGNLFMCYSYDSEIDYFRWDYCGLNGL
ncbi:unnamed protein product [Ostreobium quekettii]|uniref:Uncharacterized protein n=1 Tax=Ostreobium quekettii TaxID=121088 RepID=A0A8S1J095_9CHLO|nr:unnamed protein product [Ostreobium quekettii]|eukprot:evm.model.scf_156.10 EVM.evm.TU.scf_156.10   scf_156:87173-90948(-)